MPVSVHPENGTITAVLGTISANISSYQSEIKFLFVKAATSTTTFDVTLTDIFNNVILQRTDVTGELSEQLVLPGYGNVTLTILNSSVDEDFDYVVGLVH